MPPPPPSSLAFATNPARARSRVAGKRDRRSGTNLFLFFHFEAEAVTARRGATSRGDLVERTGTDSISPTEALNTRRHSGGDWGARER